MIELKIERNDVNVELLDSQLRAVAGDQFYGLSLQHRGVILYVSEAASTDLQHALSRITRQHDATQMTPKQEMQAARQQALEAGRVHIPLDTTPYADSPALIRALAAKIAWLEQEVRDLRGVS